MFSRAIITRTPQQALRRAYLQLVGLVVFWAANFIVVPMAFVDMGPATIGFFRFFGAIFVFLALCRWFKLPLWPKGREWLPLVFIGVLQIGAGSVMTAIALSYIPAGRASVLVYTMQLWSLVFGYFITHDRLSRMGVFGILVSCTGLALFVSPWLLDWRDQHALIGYGLVLATGITWALGSTFYRRMRWDSPALTQTLWQVLFSAILAGIVVVMLEKDVPFRWSMTVMAVMLYNWFIASMLCYVWWNEVIKVMPAATAGQFVSVTPLVVMMISAVFTDEVLTPALIISALLVTSGIIISARAAFARVQVTPEPPEF